jgi:hypothetical protein
MDFYFNPTIKTEFDESSYADTERQAVNRGGRKQVKQGTTKRNTRERNRVRYINNCFDSLRQHIPCAMASMSSGSSPTRKLSKVETLKYAAAYIRQLTLVLQQQHEELNDDSNRIEVEEPMDHRASCVLNSQTVYDAASATKTNYYQNILLNNINININDCNHYYHHHHHSHHDNMDHEYKYVAQNTYSSHHDPHHQYYYNYNFNEYATSPSVRTSSSSCSSSYSPTSTQSPSLVGKW